ncbi:hypothetical protein QQF64_028076 [Cirrhinus molitorella]|uniref:Uncharacterized protein n=1 Tax=Cirrhinus molitorella TaxID=172907 RepID=A0ABR3N5Q1_9TELE
MNDEDIMKRSSSRSDAPSLLSARREASAVRPFSASIREVSSMFSFMGLVNGTTDTHTNVSCTCNCKRSTSFQSMAISEYPRAFSLSFCLKFLTKKDSNRGTANDFRRNLRFGNRKRTESSDTFVLSLAPFVIAEARRDWPIDACQRLSNTTIAQSLLASVNMKSSIKT